MVHHRYGNGYDHRNSVVPPGARQILLEHIRIKIMDVSLDFGEIFLLIILAILFAGAIFDR